MPRLIEYVQIGICASYMDGDYRISGDVANLSRQQMNELRHAFCGAIAITERMWAEAQMAKPENQPQQASCPPQHGEGSKP